MNTFKALIAGAALVTASSAFSLTQVVVFEGTVQESDIIAPAALQGQIATQLNQLLSRPDYDGGLGYNGYLYLHHYQNYYKRVKVNGEKVFQSQSGNFDIASNPDFGFTVMANDIGGFEGERLFVPNPNYDGSNNKNDRLTNPQTPNFGELLGEASINIEDGVLGEFNWTLGRAEDGSGKRGLETYDNLLSAVGANFQLKRINLTFGTDGYSKDDPYQVLANNYVINPNSVQLTVEVQAVNEVPVPAAVWLFGSALAGLAGLKRRK